MHVLPSHNGFSPFSGHLWPWSRLTFGNGHEHMTRCLERRAIVDQHIHFPSTSMNSDSIIIFFYQCLNRFPKTSSRLHRYHRSSTHQYHQNSKHRSFTAPTLEETRDQVFNISTIVMKFPATLLSLLILITITGASSLETSSVLKSNTTFQEKHGCPSQGCPHNGASTLNSGCLEVVYGAIIMSLAALV
jgi:hypothetical protein